MPGADSRRACRRGAARARPRGRAAAPGAGAGTDEWRARVHRDDGAAAPAECAPGAQTPAVSRSGTLEALREKLQARFESIDVIAQGIDAVQQLATFRFGHQVAAFMGQVF